MSQKAAIRRRKQAAKGFRHLAKLGRPIHKKISPAKSARRLQKLLERRQGIIQRGGKVK